MSSIRKSSNIRLMLAASILLFLIFGSIWIIETRGESEWQSNVTAAKLKATTEVPKAFASWVQDVVLPDGTVEHWSGVQSDLLFIESRECNQWDSKRLIPCWTAWARTKDSQRYYKVEFWVDPEASWALRVADQRKETNIQEVVEQARRLQRTDVLKKVSSTQVNA